MQYSVVNYKTVKENSDFRIDADYYHPVYLREDYLVAKFKNIPLSEFAFITDGQHGYHEVDENSPISHLTAKNAKNWFADTKNADRLAKWVDDKNKRSSLKESDIILSTRGTVGFCAMVFKDVLPANIDQDIARIAIREKLFLPEFLLAYFNSHFGQNWIERNISGMVQQGLSLQKVRTAPIPLLSDSFQKIIQDTILKAKKNIDQSKSLYSQAEHLLLSELELLNWKQKHELAFVKNFSDTKQSDRFDAEYFQPKYEEIVEAVKKYRGGFDTIGEQFTLSKKSFKKIDDREYRYIEIGCVNISDGTMEAIILQGSELPANAKIKLQKNDVIISKVRPYRGAIGIVDNDDFVGSGAFTVLGENGIINKETLMVFLRLKPLLDFSLKFNVGTSYPVITDEDILNFPLPKIVPEIQNQIKEKIIEMYTTKSLSKSLLEIAKRGVEMAIEKNEEEAGKWIDSEVRKLEIRI